MRNLRESDIMHECGPFWVARETYGYVVYVAGITHSAHESAYALDADGLSIAIARCDYMGKRHPNGIQLRKEPA
jgi:hypothetical protein